MPDKMQPGSKEQTQKKKEANLGQKDARQQQQSDSDLEQMGEGRSKSDKNNRQQG
jgi:hypothetical protein